MTLRPETEDAIPAALAKRLFCVNCGGPANDASCEYCDRGSILRAAIEDEKAEEYQRGRTEQASQDAGAAYETAEIQVAELAAAKAEGRREGAEQGIRWACQNDPGPEYMDDIVARGLAALGYGEKAPSTTNTAWPRCVHQWKVADNGIQIVCVHCGRLS